MGEISSLIDSGLILYFPVQLGVNFLHSLILEIHYISHSFLHTFANSTLHIPHTETFSVTFFTISMKLRLQMLSHFTNSSELSEQGQVIFMKILTLYIKNKTTPKKTKTPQTTNQTKLSHLHTREINAPYFILSSTMTLKRSGLCMLSKPTTHKLKWWCFHFAIFWRGHSALSKTKNPNLEFFQLKLKQFPSTISYKFEEDFIATLDQRFTGCIYWLTLTEDQNWRWKNKYGPEFLFSKTLESKRFL